MRLIYKPETYAQAPPDHHLVQVIEALVGVANQSTSPRNMLRVGRALSKLKGDMLTYYSGSKQESHGG